MDNSRYAPGGDLFDKIDAQYGSAAAYKVYQASVSGEDGAVAEALGEIRNGPSLNDSTVDIFWDQITTDPLAAPLASANNLIGNSVASFFRNHWVVLATIGGGYLLFLYLTRKK